MILLASVLLGFPSYPSDLLVFHFSFYPHPNSPTCKFFLSSCYPQFCNCVPIIDISASTLPDIVATEITLEAPYDSPIHYGSAAWKIGKKFDASVPQTDPDDIDAGLDPGYALDNSGCWLSSACEQKFPAFMRIYQQLPMIGTKLQPPSIRRAQAVTIYVCMELKALKAYKRGNCKAVPAFEIITRKARPRRPCSRR